MKLASFFSGIGGFELGFENAGFEVVFQCEINKFNRQILKKYWPDVSKHDDIRTLNASTIPTGDVWCAGFPCQDVSLANNGKREGLKGKQSGLFYTFAELIKQILPKWIVLENVPGLLSSQKGEDFRTVIRTLDELGYGVAWRILDAKYFGTPQRRRRVFVVASYQSRCAVKVLFDNTRTTLTPRASEGQEENFAYSIRNSDQPSDIYSIQNAAIGRIHTSGPQARGYRSDGETWTFDSRGRADAICSPVNAFGIRKISGLSRGVDSPRYVSLGNAVNTAVAEWIGNGIIEASKINSFT